ncbi:MAG: ComEC family DNA internalization-related competence protein [Alphaproteobacteria bacterium]|nr:ComEC family DNA internalization-related competence protein [Alphaproteobacteria bacterium]
MGRLIALLGRGLAAPAAMPSAELRRWLLWFPVGMGSGAALYLEMTVEPPVGLAGGALLTGLGAAIALRRRRGVLGIVVGLVSVALGFVAGETRAWRQQAPVLAKALGPTAIEGRVLDVESAAGGRRFLIDRLTIAKLNPTDTPDRVRIIDRSRTGPILPGDRVRVRAILLPPAAPAGPGAYDFARDAWFKRIGAVGFATGPPQRLTAGNPGQLHIFVAGVRRLIANRIQHQLPRPTGGIAVALVVGEQAAIPEKHLQAMRDAGLAHLLSTSGLHTGLVAGIVFISLRLAVALSQHLALRYPIKIMGGRGRSHCRPLLPRTVGSIGAERAGVPDGGNRSARRPGRSTRHFHVLVGHSCDRRSGPRT